MRSLLILSLAVVSAAACAEVPGIYHPYVNAREREVEYSLTRRGGDSLHAFSFGYAWTDRLSVELYLLREFATHQAARTRGHELEVTVQLSEQGEYASDWGLLFEVEQARDLDHNELATGLLWERELGGRWVAAVNGLVEYEFGDDVEAEFETALRAQLRYRAGPALEPALELYLDDLDRVVGPALQGTWRLAPGQQVRWQTSLLVELSRHRSDHVVRAAIEFEF